MTARRVESDRANRREHGVAAQTGRSARLVAWAVAVVVGLVVFFVPFHPWQSALLEEWGFQLSWLQEGFSAYVTRLPQTLGRPLHLLPAYLGLTLSQGAIWGVELFAGVVAVAQFAGAFWATGALTQRRVLQWAFAAVIALHPWWAAGNLLRFLPAQVSVLALVLWLGAAVRLLKTGSARWLAVVVIAPIVGLLHYEALAFTLVFGAVVLVVSIPSEVRQRITLLAGTVGASVAVLSWSAFIVPQLEPQSYGSQIVDTSGGLGSISIVGTAESIARTLVSHARPLVLALLIVVVLALVLVLTQRIDRTVGLLLVGAALASPLTALTYALQALHLNDPERVAFPAGVALWIVLCALLPALDAATRVRRILVPVVLACTVAATVVNYMAWWSLSSDQDALLSGVAPFRAQVPSSSQLIVADESGLYGDVYLLLPPYLSTALDVRYGPGPDAELCTPDGVVRDHPFAALFPIGTTPDCAAVPGWDSAALLGVVNTRLGALEVYQAVDEN